MGIEYIADAIIELGPVLFPVIIVTVIAVLKQRSKRQVEAWQGAANQLGFRFVRRTASVRSFRMSGLIEKVPVELKVEVHGSGKNRSWYTVAMAELSSGIPAGMLVGKENFLTRIGEAFGFDDIEIGVPSVDNVLHIRGEDEAQIRQYLEPVSIQKTLVELVNFGHGSGLRRADIYLRKRGVVATTPTLVSMARSAARFSTQLCAIPADVAPSKLEEERVPMKDVETGLVDSGLDPENGDIDQDQGVKASETDDPGAGPDWNQVALLLCDRNARRSDKRKAAKQIEGQMVAVTLSVKRTAIDRDTVDSATGEFGALVYGTHNGLDIELRIEPKDVAVVAELKRGDSIEGTGVILDWDQFYGRLNVEYRA